MTIERCSENAVQIARIIAYEDLFKRIYHFLTTDVSFTETAQRLADPLVIELETVLGLPHEKNCDPGHDTDGMPVPHV